jgi:hypothetical protein
MSIATLDRHMLGDPHWAAETRVGDASDWAIYASPDTNGHYTYKSDCEVGISDAEIDAKIGATADNWSSADAAILSVCDELRSDQLFSDDTCGLLSRLFGEQQRIDLVFTFSQHTQVSMFLNSFGVQLGDFLTLGLVTRAPCTA